MRVTGSVSAGAIGQAGRIQAWQPQKAQAAEAERNFDQVHIESENTFQKQLLSKLSQEARAATTTGTVAALRDQVRAGTYQVNPHEIARRLLFVWGA